MSQETVQKKKRKAKLKEPSPELVNELKGLTTDADNLDKKIKSIVGIAKSEGFKESDAIAMITTALQGRYDRNKVYYLLHKEEINERNTENYEAKKSSTNSVINQQIDDKKAIEELVKMRSELEKKEAELETKNTQIAELQEQVETTPSPDEVVTTELQDARKQIAQLEQQNKDLEEELNSAELEPETGTVVIPSGPDSKEMKQLRLAVGMWQDGNQPKYFLLDYQQRGRDKFMVGLKKYSGKK